MSTTRPPAYDDRASSPVEASRRGAHRARAKPVMASLPVLAGVLVVLAAGGGVWTVVNSGTSTDSSKIQGAVPGDDDAGATAPASAGASTATPDASASATQQATPRASRSTAAATTQPVTTTVDRGVVLVILNSVPTQGLAKRVAADIEPDGWTVSRTDNSVQRNLATTKVYYGLNAKKATAQALVKDLGFGVLVKDASVAKNGSLLVVLGQDAV